ncbi:MAG: hypothetical protein OEZ21_07030 [Candidatus Bathyarchaeota archaeon]|nr:hypothetical protein [Candidatus Bathyarchaeota archaeon]MDH5746689.1 hypothetical protein [Candidatus Bathyarchaeota archaeon]
MKISTIIRAGLHQSKLLLNLFFIWLTLGWKVRKARKAFEKELVKSGMPSEAAKKLGKKYSSVKDEVMKQLWGSVRKSKR